MTAGHRIDLDPDAILATSRVVARLATSAGSTENALLRSGGIPAGRDSPVATAYENVRVTWATTLRAVGQDLSASATAIAAAAIRWRTQEESLCSLRRSHPQ